MPVGVEGRSFSSLVFDGFILVDFLLKVVRDTAIHGIVTATGTHRGRSECNSTDTDRHLSVTCLSVCRKQKSKRREETDKLQTSLSCYPIPPIIASKKSSESFAMYDESYFKASCSTVCLYCIVLEYDRAESLRPLREDTISTGEYLPTIFPGRRLTTIIGPPPEGADVNSSYYLKRTSNGLSIHEEHYELDAADEDTSF